MSAETDGNALMKTLWEENQDFVLKEDLSGQLWLAVSCSGTSVTMAVQYMVEVPLTPEETAAYRKRRKSIRSLASEIRGRPTWGEARRREWFAARGRAAGGEGTPR